MKNFRTLILSLLLVLSLAVAGCGLAPEPPCYHEWGEWGVATSATCTVDGLKTRICSKCEEVDSQVISSLGHDLQQYEAKAVTCTEIGWEAYETCSRCDYTTYEEKTALGHDKINHDGQEATCTEIGWEAYETCSRCDYSTYEEIPAGHDKIQHEAQAPTCTEIGWNAYETCTRCDYTTYEEILALDHDMEDRICTRCEYRIDEGLVFTLVGEEYSVTRYNGSASKVVIPELYQSKTVTSIGSYAFYECYSLTSVEIPDSVTSIRIYAFAYCNKLTSIEIPDGVTSIGEYAFYECYSLTSIDFGENSQLTSIGERAFFNCDSLTSIEIPSSVTSIGKYAFYECYSLTSVDFGENSQLTSIGERAFFHCDSLTSIEIPASVTSIGEGAFYNYNSLTIYCEAESKPSGWDSSWKKSSCPVVWNYGGQRGTTEDGLVWIALNNGITITSYSGNLTTIEIPAVINDISVTSIRRNAFKDCSSLTSIEIPDSVTSIDYYAFSGCPIESATIPTIAISSIPTSKLKTVIINGGTSRGNSAFSSCGSLTSIEIPESVTSIGNYAFYNCSSLTSIEIPDSVTSIGYSAFYNCDSLTSIEIPDSVTSIGEYAFYNCSSLTIYCETESKPSGWHSSWNYSNRPVYWKGEWEYVNGVPTPKN